MLIFSRYSWWVAAMVALAVLLGVASQLGVLNPLQGAFLTVTSPIEKGFSSLFRPVATFLSDAGDLRELQEENRRLRLENESLQNEVTRLRLAGERVRELEQALDILKAEIGQQKLAANVVHRSSSPFTDTLSIDRGSSDGIRTGMVVLSSQGTLLGTVTTVTANRSFVRLITDSASRVAAETVETRFDGIVKGGANRTLSFDFAQADVKVGDVIVTSALTGRFPQGIPIGRVAEVAGTAQDLFRTVRLDPLVRVSTVRTVIVLLGFEPAQSGAATP
jgi:rod shape-determining protein MreC